MYTKKLLRSTWSIKEILSIILIFAVIVVILSFIEFQDAKGDLDDLIGKEGSVTVEGLEKIEVFSPVSIMGIVAAFAFGLAFVSQLFTLSLQMNVTRKHLHTAALASEIISSLVISATLISAKLGVNLLISKLCTGRYSPLADKFRDAAFNMSLTGKSSMGTVPWILIMFFGTFALTLIGSLLMMLLSGKKGAAILLRIFGFCVVFGGIIAALMIIGNRYVSFAVLSVMLIGLAVIQYKRMMKMSLENFSTIKTV